MHGVVGDVLNLQNRGNRKVYAFQRSYWKPPEAAALEVCTTHTHTVTHTVMHTVTHTGMQELQDFNANRSAADLQ